MLIIKRTKIIIKSSKLFYVVAFCREVFQYFKRSDDNSETGESKLIGRYISKNAQNYIDVGSGRPITNSNTYELYKLGWAGILVDPFALNISLTRFFRKRDSAINGIVSSKKVEAVFHFFEPYEYSTYDPDSFRLLKEHKFAIYLYSKAILPIALSELQTLQAKDYIVSIDVEGSEFDVIDSADLSDSKLLLICIETDQSGVSTDSRVRKRLLDFGFFEIANTSKSTIFLNSKRYDSLGVLI